MKLFISQPMAGRGEEDLIREREWVIAQMRRRYGPDVEIIDSLLRPDKDPVWLLGESIKLMSLADAVYFCRGWQRSRGCMVEYMIAGSYGINVIMR